MARVPTACMSISTRSTLSPGDLQLGRFSVTPFPSLKRYFPSDASFDKKESYQHVVSKTQKDKVMFFAAVYRPRPDINEAFDGKLMLKVAHKKKVLSRLCS